MISRGLENCYLMTNGLGGFSSLTMTGAAARNDHAFLMACVQAPNHRYNLVHRLKEELIFAEKDGGAEAERPAERHRKSGRCFPPRNLPKVSRKRAAVI